MLRFDDVLDDAMYSGNYVEVKTKSRGVIRGLPTAVDEYDTDENRLGYYVSLGNGWEDTVFLDEIVDIKVVSQNADLKKAI